MKQMMQIRIIVRNIIRPKPNVMLGRWQISNSESTISNVIKMANEDHCGTCVNVPKEQPKNHEKPN